MTREELEDFIRLNQEFHATADKIKIHLDEGMAKESAWRLIGVCSDFELIFQPHHYHLLMLANQGSHVDKTCVLFGEDGTDAGVTLRVPLKAFFSTDEEMKILAQGAIDEFLKEFREDQAIRDKQNEARDRENYERLKNKFEKQV